MLAGYIGVIKKAEIQAARRKRPADLGAFELYLLGLDASYRQSEAGLQEGIEYYKRAIAPTLLCRGPTLDWRTISNFSLFL